MTTERDALTKVRDWLADSQMETWPYMENGPFYEDRAEMLVMLNAALAGRDAAPPSLTVAAEVARATAKFPTWPTDPLHAVAVLGEEFGELTKAVLQSVYEPHKSDPGDVRAEAVQTAAMAMRFLASLDHYEYAKGAQHAQGESPTGSSFTPAPPSTKRGRDDQANQSVHRATNDSPRVGAQGEVRGPHNHVDVPESQAARKLAT